jgi:mono/diheme cytochrome c family protein
MRNFILGVIVTLVVLFVVVIVIAQFGLMPTNADATPSPFESRIAMNALDASIERHAPRVNNPVPATDDNLIDGMKSYTMNCAVCHGTLDYKPSLLEHSMYPPPPQLILAPMDDPEWHIYYAIRTGVRYTGMPGWSKALDDQEMWKVTGFLTRLEKLPPAVKEFWKKSYGVEPRAASEHEGHEGHEH